MNMHILITITRYTEYEIMSLFSFTNGLHIIIHKQSAKHPKIDFQEIIIVAKLLKEVSFFGDK